MQRVYTTVFVFLAIILAVLFCWMHPSQPLFQAGSFSGFLDLDQEERFEAAKMRLPDHYEDISHGAQLGFNWRAAQATQAAHLRGLFYENRARSGQYGSFDAEWIERGPTGIPGRVTGSAVLYGQQRVYLLTDGGYLFRGSLSGNDWICLNDHRPLARGVNARLQVIPNWNGGGNRLLVGGWDGYYLGPGFLLYSDDEGATWQTPAGLPPGAWYRRTIARDNGQVWHMLRTDDAQGAHMRILYSADGGAHFSTLFDYLLTQGDYDRRCDMWKPDNNVDLFAVFEDRCYRIAPDGQAVISGPITQKPNPEWAILAGGIAPGAQDYTLFLRVWDGTENGIYRSTDNGQQWSRWGALPEGGLLWPFSNYAFNVDPADPSRVWSGGWILGVSDNGTDWHYPHDLGGYVGYHGDVPDINFTLNPNTGRNQLFIGTDGGYYQYAPSTDQFTSLSLQTLNNTQIYRMASSHAAENRMYIGTQDNGFCFHNDPYDAQTGKASYQFLWGGDVTQLVSGDAGKSFWCFWWGLGCNYVQDAAQIQQSGVANWSPIYDSEYWELPAKADPFSPDECLVAGYRTPSPDGSFLVRLKAPDDLQSGELKPLEQTYGDFDFKSASGGGRIGAIGISPLNPEHLYVMTDNGVFFWSLDKGLTWQQNDVARNRIWVRYIAVSPTQPGQVFIGGAAYGNEHPPCWRSDDHGQTLTPAEAPLNSLLRDNRVNGLCFDPSGELLFAATDLGAFAYPIASGVWQYIGGDPAPSSHFHDCEYLENSHSVRFATYARGVWDFKITQASSSVQSDVNQSAVQIRPNPASHWLEVQYQGASFQQARIWSLDGRLLGASNSQPIPLQHLEKGSYLLELIWPNGSRCVKKFIKT